MCVTGTLGIRTGGGDDSDLLPVDRAIYFINYKLNCRFSLYSGPDRIRYEKKINIIKDSHTRLTHTIDIQKSASIPS